MYLEQRDILSQELGQVDIEQGAEQQDTLVLLRVLELEVAGGGEHGLDCAHAVVVVMLGGQLLRAQAVRRHDLLGQAGRAETGLQAAARPAPPGPAPSEAWLARGLDGEALLSGGLWTELPQRAEEALRLFQT